MNLPRRSTFKGVLKVYTLSKILLWIKLGGPATAFDLAAFRLSMIAPIKKCQSFDNCSEHARNRWEKQQLFAAIRPCEVNSLL